MKFRYVDTPDFTVRVEVITPGEENLGAITFNCKAKTRAQLQTLSGADYTPSEAVAEFVTGWDIEEKPFSAAELSDLCDKYPFVPLAIFREYFTKMNGVYTKN